MPEIHLERRRSQHRTILNGAGGGNIAGNISAQNS
jgi:hypothetical protein